MADKKLIKSSKQFVLSDNSLNTYGFRILTEGMDLTRFKANPILLFMHERAGVKYAENPTMPIGIWEDIHIEGDQLIATPSFDPEDELAMVVYGKVEKGILRMASIGAEPKEESCEPEFMLPGQYRSTVTKSEPLEASIVDIGGNGNAMALRLPKEGRILLDASNIDTYLPPINNKKMTIKLSAKTLIALGHENSESLTETAIEAAVEQLANKVSSLELAKGTAETNLKKVQDEKAALEIQLSNQKIDNLLDKAQGEGRITAVERPTMAKLAAASSDGFENVKTLIDSRPAVASIEAQLAAGASGAAGDSKLLEMSWDAIDQAGQLKTLKLSFPNEYAKKYEQRFGKKLPA